MLLTVDVGNTQTALGLYEGEELKLTWRIATDKQRTADEVRTTLSMLLNTDGVAFDEIEGAALASVVPNLTLSWVRAMENLLDVDVLVCNAKTAGALFQTDYPSPDEIGADRVADAVAAVARCGAPVVVVDFGTATNIEVIDRDGKFVGGIIAPGMEISSEALYAAATRLSVVSLKDPESAIGRSTADAIRSGIVYGEADRADGLIRRVFAELGYEAPVVATGGLADVVAAYSSLIGSVERFLTLEGLRLIYDAEQAR